MERSIQVKLLRPLVRDGKNTVEIIRRRDAKIEQYNEDMLVQVFDSVADAAHWCVDNGYAKTYNGGVRSHISNAAKHKTKTAYGYRWEYAQ